MTSNNNQITTQRIPFHNVSALSHNYSQPGTTNSRIQLNQNNTSTPFSQNVTLMQKPKVQNYINFNQCRYI